MKTCYSCFFLPYSHWSLAQRTVIQFLAEFMLSFVCQSMWGVLAIRDKASQTSEAPYLAAGNTVYNNCMLF